LILLSLFEVLLQCVAETLGELNKLPFPLLQSLFTGGSGDEACYLIYSIKQFLNCTCYLPEKKKSGF
jgi:hypothetical protein